MIWYRNMDLVRSFDQRAIRYQSILCVCVHYNLTIRSYCFQILSRLCMQNSMTFKLCNHISNLTLGHSPEPTSRKTPEASSVMTSMHCVKLVARSGQVSCCGRPSPRQTFPFCDSIVQLCERTPPVSAQNGICFEIEGIPRFWIKYSVSITLRETLTQNQVADRDRERRNCEHCAHSLRLLTRERRSADTSSCSTSQAVRVIVRCLICSWQWWSFTSDSF